MNMVVKYRLPGGSAVGLQDPYSVRFDRGLDSAGNQPGAQSDRREAGFINVQDVNPMFPGDHQNVSFAGRLNVHESNGEFVLMNFDERSYIIGDLTENALIFMFHRSAAPLNKYIRVILHPVPMAIHGHPFTRHLLYYRHIPHLSAKLSDCKSSFVFQGCNKTGLCYHAHQQVIEQCR